MLVSVALSMCASALLSEFAKDCYPPTFLTLGRNVEIINISTVLSERDERDEFGPKVGRFLTLSFWYASIILLSLVAFVFGYNLNMYAYKYLSSHLVTLLANFKLLVTAGLASVYLKQKFSMLQWISLVLVVSGLVVTMGDPGKS